MLCKTVILLWCLTVFLLLQTQKDNCINKYVSLRLRVQNAVPAQPCVGKYWISLILLNFLHCNFRLWFKTPQPFNSYPCHASEVTRNTLNHCLKFTVRSIFCHICYGKISEKMSTLSLKLNYSSPRHQTAVSRFWFVSNALSFSQVLKIPNKFTHFHKK